MHAEGTLWRVHAGPFQVRVTGTRFTTTWNGGKLQVALYEGSVVIEGALLGAGVPLRAGQRLTIEGETAVTEPLATEPNHVGSEPVGPEPVRGVGSRDAPEEVEPGPTEPNDVGSVPVRSEPVRGVRTKVDPEWAVLAARGDYPGAFQSAERLGWSALCRRRTRGAC